MYSPFGCEYYNEPNEHFNVTNRYTSQIFDENIGLYYYGARYYDPELARFIQPDTEIPQNEIAGSQNFNRYSYSFNNPLKYNDPSGNSPAYTGHDQGYNYSGMIMGAYYGATQAGTSGGDVIMGAYVGAINGATNNTLIATTNSRATYLTSVLTGDFGETENTNSWTPFKYDYSHRSYYQVDWENFENEAGHFALDAAGMAEGTVIGPTADTVNAVWYASERRWKDAGISFASIFCVDLLVKGGKYATKTLSSGKNVVRFADEGASVVQRGWKRGDPITNFTTKGDVPSWKTVRSRFWKNESLYHAGEYSSENLARMRRGLAEQRINPITGLIESRHLHHNPPQSQGNLFFFEKLWPDEHFARHSKK